MRDRLPMNDLLVIADPATSETRDVLQALRTTLRGDAHIREASDLNAGFAAIAEAPPDLVIVLQTWSDEFARSQVDRLLAAAPLARWIVGTGAWCESVGRNRDTWPVAVRAPFPLVPSRVERELAVLRGERSATPLTASRDEAFAADVEDGIAVVGRGELVAVVSPDRRLRETWSAVLAAAGFGVKGAEAVAAVVLFDADPWNEVVRARLGAVVTDAPVVAVAELPTPARRRGLEKAGVAAVVPKLAPADVLIAAVRAAIGHRPAAASAG